MEQEDHKQEKKHLVKTNSRALIIGGALFVIVVLAACDGFLAYAAQYHDKAYRGIFVGSTDVSGKTLSEIETIVREYQRAVETDGVEINSPSKKYHLLTSAGSPDASTSFDYIRLDSNDIAAKALGIGRGQGTWNSITTALSLLLAPKSVPMNLEFFDDEGITSALEDFFQDEETHARDANIIIEKNESLAVVTDVEGMAFDWASVVQTVRERVRQMDLQPVPIALSTESAIVKTQEVENLQEEVRSTFSRLPLSVTHKDKKWDITKTLFAKGLMLQKTNGAVQIALNSETTDSFFDAVGKDVEVSPKEARFKMDKGKVSEFQAAQNGTLINRESSLERIVAALNTPDAKSTELVVEEIKPLSGESDALSLGIEELVATGKTNFAGSPANRRFNIKVAAEKLNGTLIKPGETFSLITAVGPVDGKNGYLQELVIKGNKTVPEYGGGLCQIGTTFFRLVLNSGLPVLERRNHSYRVSYYEPPVGMDATIYEPKPDFRFTNDYKNPLLLQTRIEGNNLIFDFYGTKDGRVAKSSAPKVYNYVKPPAKKLIETDTLKPGQTKCIERAHTGADAEFTYTVTDAAGKTVSTVFKSHYKPWQEVCLVGKAAEPESAEQTN